MLHMNTIMEADAKKPIRTPLSRMHFARELALFETRERLVLSEIANMERKYAMTSSGFLNKFESGIMGDDQDYFVWWSLIRGLETIRARKDF